jgi:hypothetical protein
MISPMQQPNTESDAAGDAALAEYLGLGALGEAPAESSGLATREEGASHG